MITIKNIITNDGSVIIAPCNELLSINFSIFIFNIFVAISTYIPSLSAKDNHTRHVDTIDFIISLFEHLKSITPKATIDNIECTPKFIGNNLIIPMINPNNIPFFITLLLSISIPIPNNINPDKTKKKLSGSVLVIV